MPFLTGSPYSPDAASPQAPTEPPSNPSGDALRLSAAIREHARLNQEIRLAMVEAMERIQEELREERQRRMEARLRQFEALDRGIEAMQRTVEERRRLATAARDEREDV